MHERISELLETFSKSEPKKMLADASVILREEAKYRFPTLQYHQDRIVRLQAFLGWSARRTRSIYNGEEGVSLRGPETLRIAEIKAAQEARERREQEEDDDALSTRITQLEAQIAFLIEALAGDEVEAARNASRAKVSMSASRGNAAPSRRSTDRA